MTQEKLRTYYRFFTDLWKYFKSCHDSPPEDEDAWETAVQECNRLGKEYGDVFASPRFARTMVLGVMSEIEALNRKGG